MAKGLELEKDREREDESARRVREQSAGWLGFITFR